eukprot:SAG22_NODE_6464_length_851_cov_0.711436_2_plen_150_part_00
MCSSSGASSKSVKCTPRFRRLPPDVDSRSAAAESGGQQHLLSTMPAFLVGQVKVKDPAKWAEYVRGVATSLAPFERAGRAEIVMRGTKTATLAGPAVTAADIALDTVVVIKFEDAAALTSWFASDLYQKLIPGRDEGAVLTITTYEAAL